MIGVLVRLVVLLCFVVFVGWVVGGFYLDAVVKKGLERVGPQVTGTDVSVGKVSLSLVLGRGNIQGLVVGNPKGFHTDRAYHAPEIRVVFDPLSVVTGTMVINEIHVKRPEITYEVTLGGNNLETIERRARAFAREHGGTGGRTDRRGEDDLDFRHVRIDRIDVTNPTLRVSASLLRGRTLSFELDDIHLRDIGARSEGVTMDNATAQVLAKTVGSVQQVVSKSGEILSKGARRVERPNRKAPASGDERAAKSLKRGLDDLREAFGRVADFFGEGSSSSGDKAKP